MLEAGTVLGPYEIRGPLGSGGMGEVYRARDTRLDRTVAIKVLPEHLSRDPARRERFEREARAVSSLNHPNICTLHDIGEHEGVHFLVMEHIEGETLSDRLKKGALPLDQALDYGVQMADALHKAHRAGIVHRDLKPGNVMLTKVGVKLLDFGLAKTREENVTPTEDSEQPTQNKPLTDVGTILGTVQYMAPEQLAGKDVDAGADLFALGAVLYEMLTGRKAFVGESQASLISAIMSSEPPAVSELQSMSPPVLDRAVRTCLAKDPDDRWQSARDFGRELKWIREAGDGTREEAVPRKHYAVVATGALVALALLANVLLPPREQAPARTRFVVDIPRGQSQMETSASAPPFALSPDGDRLAYVAASGPSRVLYVRPLDRFEAIALPGTEGARIPFFSPNGEWIGFFANGSLQKVPVGGGTPIVICDSPRPIRGATWGAGDTIVFITGLPSVLQRVSAAGGQPETLTTPSGNRMWPTFLPDGHHVLYGIGQADYLEAFEIKVLELETGESRTVYRAESAARHVRFLSRDGRSSGHLVYFQGGGLVAVPFDADELRVTGSAVPVMSGIHSALAVPFFTTSLRGGLALVPGGETMEVVWVDRNGQPTKVPIESLEYDHPRLSPDGTHVVLHESEQSRAWIYDVAKGGRTRLSTTEVNHTVWSPDGSRVAYRAGQEIYLRPADGSGEAELLWSSENIPSPISWSPDDLIAFEERAAAGWDIWVLDVRKRVATPWMETPATEASPMFSPDGRWLAYVSNEGGRRDVYLQPYPGPGPKIPVSVGGGAEPLWSPDGRELFYRDGQRMLVVDVEMGPTVRVGTPRELFTESYQTDVNGHPHYGISPDGERLLMLRNEAASVVRVILDWADELERLAPAER